MKKLKSCIFLILTVLFSASVFAFNAVPPDKPMFEIELIANDAPENGFVNVIEQDPAINSDLIEKTLTAKRYPLISIQARNFWLLTSVLIKLPWFKTKTSIECIASKK